MLSVEAEWISKPPAPALDQHRVVRGVGQRVRVGKGVPKRLGPEGLGRLDRPEASPVERPLHLARLGCLLDGVGDRRRRDHARCVVIGHQLLDHGVDQPWGDQRPGSIVDDDDLTCAKR